MSPSYYKRLRERQLRRSRLGVEARERKRQAEAEAAVCLGTIVFDGPTFGGTHTLRLLHSPTYSERHLMVEIDGQAHAPRTRSGIVKVVASRICREMDVKRAPVPWRRRPRQRPPGTGQSGNAERVGRDQSDGQEGGADD